MIERNHLKRKRKSPFLGIRREREVFDTAPRGASEEARAELSSHLGGDLDDCNEQESEKMGFSPWETQGIQEKEPKEEPSDGTRLPSPSCERRSVQKAEGLDGRTEEEEPMLLDVGEEKGKESDPPKEKGGEGRVVSRVCAGILVAILTFSLVTLLVSVVASRPSEEAQGFVDAETSGADGTAQKPDRVVFVKQYDDESGILTTAELYHRCVGSVVSILTQGKGATGVGSGFFLSADGYIATANHVVEGMDSLTVVEADGTRYRAVLVSGNALTDLALLKIEKTDCSPLIFASSDELLIGERVIAIGTPASLDYAGSVCSGELSYVDRRVSIYGSDGQIQKKMILLQTDASLNPGNSGCPLFDEYGRVVGIVTMRLGDSYEGMGFAIPSSGAMPILQAMMQGEELTESLLSAVSTTAPSLGILGEAQSEGGICGVRVLDFSSATAPISYILKKGDLIVQIDGTPIASRSDVASAIGQKIPGDTVAVTVLRGGQWLTFRLSLMSAVTEEA